MITIVIKKIFTVRTNCRTAKLFSERECSTFAEYSDTIQLYEICDDFDDSTLFTLNSYIIVVSRTPCRYVQHNLDNF